MEKNSEEIDLDDDEDEDDYDAGQPQEQSVPAAVFGGALLAAAGDGEEAEGALARMKRQRNQ